jgi:hypothetical protein
MDTIDYLKVIVIAPILLGGALAIMVLSYAMVPIILVGFVIMVGIVVIKTTREPKKKRKKGKYRRL